ncbi:MAG: hypothetical protein ACO3IB_14950 [Phycisphaerales bacterium]
MDYIARPTWHVYDDCTLKVFERQRQVLALEPTPSEAIKLAADLIIAARRMQSSAPS